MLSLEDSLGNLVNITPSNTEFNSQIGGTGSFNVYMGGGGLIFEDTFGGAAALQVANVYIWAAPIASTGKPALEVVGDPFADPVLWLKANNGGIGSGVNVVTVDQFGSTAISPTLHATASALTVVDDGGGVHDIADFYDTTGAYNVVAIGQPLSGNSAMLIQGDGTSAPVFEVAAYISSHVSYGGYIGTSIGMSLTGTGTLSDGTTNVLLEQVMSDGVVTGGLINLEVHTEPGGLPGCTVDTVTGILARTQVGEDVSGVTELVSVSGLVYAAVSTVPEAIGFYTQPEFQNGGTITTAYGFYADAPLDGGGGGSIGTAYGIYVADMTIGNLHPANYGIFVAGGPSVFAGVATAIVTKTTTYTATQSDHTINCNGTFTLTLPTTNIKVGQEYYIKNIGIGTIIVSSTANIDFALTFSLTTQGESITVQWDGTQYWIY